MTETDETPLIQRAQAGDRHAFGALVERYWDQVYSWLNQLTRSTHAAEDLTQETFLKAWNGLASYASGPGFRAWLFRIARNSWVDHVRRRTAVADNALIESVVARDAGPAEAALDRERDALLEEAIAALPDDYREAFLLRAQQAMPFAEIAEVLTTTSDTARWRVYKARQLLLRKLAAYLDPEKLTS